MSANKIKTLSSYLPLSLIIAGLIFVNLHKPITVYKVSKSSTTTSLAFSSVINPLTTQNVISPVEGSVINMIKQYGSNVKKNDLLITLRSPQVETDFNQNIENYVKAKAAFQKTQFNYTGNQELYKLGLLSKVAFMDNQSQLHDAEFGLLDAEDKIKDTLEILGMPFSNFQNLSIDDMRKVKAVLTEKLNAIQVVSPATGVFLFPSNTLGTTGGDGATRVKPGDNVKKGGVIGVIADMSGLILLINITENNFYDVKVGDEASIMGNAFSDTTLKGQVSSIERQANGGDFNSIPTYVGKVTVPKLTPQESKILQVGMSAQVTLRKVNPPTIRIPIKAVISSNGQYYVNIQDEDGSTHTIPVVTGSTDESSVEILSGLSEGDNIVFTN